MTEELNRHEDQDELFMGREHGIRVTADSGRSVTLGLGHQVGEITPDQAIAGRKYGLRIGRVAIGVGPRVNESKSPIAQQIRERRL